MRLSSRFFHSYVKIINRKVKENLKTVRKFATALMMIAWVWTTCLAYSPQRPDISAIEKKLREWINKERTARHLKPVRFSQDLRTVAAEHSKDMAFHQNLTHLSSSGKSYLDRLVEAGLFFVDIGENVAVSDTFDAAFIHQKFMESEEHRDNILNPKYDTVGIGVVYSKGLRYYITQDFSQSLNKLETEEAEAIIRNKIAKIRKERALAPMSFPEVANTFARRYAQNRATGKPLQNIASVFGETHVHFLTTPVLNIHENIKQEIASEMYESGAVGAWFGRLKDYPGGTYLVTVLLFPISLYESKTDEDFRQMALDAMNAKRKDSGLNPVKLDRRQSRHAIDISKQIKAQQTGSVVMRKRPMNIQVMTYVTENPGVWPVELDPIITDPGLRRIGIGISSQKSKGTYKQTFWITLIF
jgi:uncharacterized protein YkwD